jgi:hypothetical protein
VLKSLLDAIEEEDDIASICTFYNCLADGIKTVGPSSLNPEQMKLLTFGIKTQLEQYLVRNTGRQQLREAEDYDPADEDALQDEEFGDDQFLADVFRYINIGFFHNYGFVQSIWCTFFAIL